MRYLARFLSIAVAFCLLGASAHAAGGPYSNGGPFGANGSSGGSTLNLTTSGSSGAATYSGGVLNIPNYSSSAQPALSITTSAVSYKVPLSATTTSSGLSQLYSSSLSFTASTGVLSTPALTLSSSTTGALSANGSGVVVSGTLPVADGGTNCSSASITCFNNITGYSASGSTGTTSTNLVFSASPTFTGTIIAANETLSGTTTTANVVVTGNFTMGSTVLSGVQGNGSLLQLAAGATTSGHLLIYDANGNAIDGGVAPASGGTVNSGTTPELAYYASSSTAVSSASKLQYNATTKGLNDNGVTLIFLPNAAGDLFSVAAGNGAAAAMATTTGYNSAFGYNALNAVTTGTGNTGIGRSAGSIITTGGSNTILGALVASTTLTTGTNNILIGVDNTVDTALTTTSSTLNIGNLLAGVITNATHASQAPLTLTATGSGVNGIKIQNTVTGAAPIITTSGTDTNGVGLGVAINALTATATGNGGGITLTAGNGLNAGGVGGAISITAGTSSGAAGPNATLKGGTASSGATGGGATVQGGDSPNGNAGGAFLQGGNSISGNGNGGQAAVTGGAPSGSNKNGGNTSMTGGVSTGTGISGNATIAGGAGSTTSGTTAGVASLTGGAGGAAASTDGNIGGVASLTGGAGGTTNNAGGIAKVVGGAGAGSRAGGQGQVTGGAGGATGVGGDVTLTSGAGGATSGVAGNITLALGVTTSSAGGTLPSINAGGFLNFTTTQAAIAAETGVHVVTANKLALTATGTDEFTVAAGLVAIPNIATDATHTDATVCEDTTSHALYFGSGTAGVCLGTSSIRYKNDIVSLPDTLPDLMRLRPISFHYKPWLGDPKKLQRGLLAEEAIEVYPDLVALDNDGNPNQVDYGAMPILLLKAVQEQQREIEHLKDWDQMEDNSSCWFIFSWKLCHLSKETHI